MNEDVKKGLMGVIVDSTNISNVDAEKSVLTYRGYLVNELADQCSFEEVIYLLLNGKLPNQNDLNSFSADERDNRRLPDHIISALKLLPKSSHPMDVLRTCISALGCNFNCRHSSKVLAISLISKIPTIIAMFFRLSQNKEIIEPTDDKGISANFFQMCFGSIPDQQIINDFDKSLILYAEHSFNASTFTSRVITSSMSDIFGAVCGAIASLKGPLHGGANEAVMQHMLQIEQLGDADRWLRKKLSNKEKIMGFGHRVYRHGDSRVPMMKQCLEHLSVLKNNSTYLDIYHCLEKIMINEKNIFPNLDFPAGPVYYLMGFPINLFTPIFVMSRIAGWAAHIIEQENNNKLIRPLSLYTGDAQRIVPDISTR